MSLIASLVLAAAVAQAAPPAAAPAPIVPYEAQNPNEPGSDRLSTPRRLAAAIVAQEQPEPHKVVDVGSFTGEFLEAFLEQFPAAHGQWTEPVETNRGTAARRLARFGDRVDYVIGCPGRDISQGCVPRDVDVLITSWISIHQNLAGIQKFYKLAAERLPSGGWVANLDHVASGDAAWDRRLKGARPVAVDEALAATIEGPPVHHADFKTPTLDDQLAALRSAGFDDVAVVWRRLDTVLIVARKH